MRKQLLGIFLPLAMVLTAAAETQSTGVNANNHASVQKVIVTQGNDGIILEVIGHGQFTPKVETLDSPARLVVNLPNTAMATSVTHIDVGGSDVKDVRIGTDSQAVPTTRVVVDLLHKCRYEVVPGADGKLTVVDSLEIKEGKTKLYFNALGKLGVTRTALLVENGKTLSQALIQGARNLEGVELLLNNEVHPYDLLRYERAIFSKAAIEQLTDSLVKSASKRRVHEKEAA